MNRDADIKMFYMKKMFIDEKEATLHIEGNKELLSYVHQYSCKNSEKKQLTGNTHYTFTSLHVGISINSETHKDRLVN